MSANKQNLRLETYPMYCKLCLKVWRGGVYYLHRDIGYVLLILISNFIKGYMPTEEHSFHFAVVKVILALAFRLNRKTRSHFKCHVTVRKNRTDLDDCSQSIRRISLTFIFRNAGTRTLQYTSRYFCLVVCTRWCNWGTRHK